MTNTRKSIRIASIVLTLATLLSIFTIIGTVSAGAAPKNRVSLYCANPTFSKYGMTSYEVYIQTKDDCKDQKVYVHYNYLDSEKWRDEEAKLYKVMNDGSKIWKANFTSYNTRYCIKYVANGVTYWDNNNGKDYTYGTSIGSETPVIAQKRNYQYYDSYNGYQVEALLQNYGYHKNVFVRYTTNGWKTYHDQAMSYSKSNTNGTEVWTAGLKIGAAAAASESFQYAICYQVNGKEYWANNFGENYDRSYYVNH